MAARFALALLFLVACGAAGAPDTRPDITGTITRLTPAGSVGSILVEERPEQVSGSAKASVRVTEATTIWRTAGTTTARGSFGELAAGLVVRVWFEGPVAESYPVQGAAKTIVILGR